MLSLFTLCRLARGVLDGAERSNSSPAMFIIGGKNPRYPFRGSITSLDVTEKREKSLAYAEKPYASLK